MCFDRSVLRQQLLLPPNDVTFEVLMAFILLLEQVRLKPAWS